MLINFDHLLISNYFYKDIDKNNTKYYLYRKFIILQDSITLYYSEKHIAFSNGQAIQKQSVTGFPRRQTNYYNFNCSLVISFYYDTPFFFIKSESPSISYCFVNFAPT